MGRESRAMRSAEQEEVQLVSRDELIPVIKTKPFLPKDEFKGFRFRSFFYEGHYRTLQIKTLYYRVWKQHPWVRAMVDKIANFATIIGWDIKYEGEGTQNPKDSKSIRDFFRFPNYKESFPDIIWKTIVQLKLFAESFWEIVKSPQGFPQDFWILDGSVKPIVDQHGNPIPGMPAYIQKVMADEAEFAFDEVLHFRFLDPMGNLRPSSELEALELTVLVDIYAMQLNKQNFLQGVRKGKAFIFPADTGEEEMKRNRAQIDNLHQGILGAFSAFVALEGECKVEDLKLSETQMEAKQLREYLRDEMSAVLGTPLSKIGIRAADVKESQLIDKSFFQEEVKPILDLIQNTINRYLDLVGILDYRFMFREFPIRDLKETARLIDVLKKHGTVSQNEIREMTGLPLLASPDADRPYLILKDGTVIFTDDISQEKVKIDEKKKSEVAHQFSFLGGPRKITRKGSLFPSAVGEEDLEEEEEYEPDPFY